MLRRFALTSKLAARRMESMSAVDDVRKAIQDFLAPELRTISARLDAIEKIMYVKFEAVEVKLDSLSKQIQAVDNKLDIDRRLTKLEARQAATQ
jgi:hypothetical protein